MEDGGFDLPPGRFSAFLLPPTPLFPRKMNTIRDRHRPHCMWPSIAMCAAIATTMTANCSAAPANPPTATRWLVYNATLRGVAGNAKVDNGFNANCKGWSWQQAGFTDASGALLPVNPTTGNIMNGNMIVGTKAGPGRWVNNTTGIGVADLSGGATLQTVYDGMLPFANNQDGLLHISTHGPVRHQDGNAVPGGMIILDNNRTYAGFKEPGSNKVGGTGVPRGTPYLIAAAGTDVGSAGGGRFNLELYNCNSALDPDGPGVQRSVVASAPTGFGQVSIDGNLHQRVIGVTGSVPVVACTVDVTATNIGTLTKQQFNEAVAAFMVSFPGKFNNCATPSSWLAGFAAEDHMTKLNTMMNKIPLNAAGTSTVQPSWHLNYVQNTVLARASDEVAMDNPVIFTPGFGSATARYNSPQGGLGASCTISSLTGGNVDGTTLHLCSAADIDLELIGTPAPELTLATSMVRLSSYADSFAHVIGSASLQYSSAIDPSTISLYELDGNTWIPFSTPGSTIINLTDMTATADFSFAGDFDEASGVVVAGFGVPKPFVKWADGAGLAGDVNLDGVPDGLTWALGAADPQANSYGLLPQASTADGGLRIDFDCLKPAGWGPTARLLVEFSNDLGVLDPWDSNIATIPDLPAVPGAKQTVNGIEFYVIEVDSTRNHVRAEMPRAAASASGKLFARLKVTGP